MTTERQTVNQWIPCSERLPEERLYVLVTYEYVYGMIDHGIEYVRSGVWTGSRNDIAWCELPSPYKEVTDGNHN